jgi:hypothetical protein
MPAVLRSVSQLERICHSSTLQITNYGWSTRPLAMGLAPPSG